MTQDRDNDFPELHLERLPDGLQKVREVWVSAGSSGDGEYEVRATTQDGTVHRLSDITTYGRTVEIYKHVWGLLRVVRRLTESAGRS